MLAIQTEGLSRSFKGKAADDPEIRSKIGVIIELAAAMIKKELKDEYQVESKDNEIHIHHFQDGERINRLLANNGIYASVIAQHKMDLEEYFLASMEGRKHV